MGKIRNQANLRRMPRRSFAHEAARVATESTACASALVDERSEASSARDNSIVTALHAYRARVQRLREIKTNVLSLAHLHGARIRAASR